MERVNGSTTRRAVQPTVREHTGLSVSLHSGCSGRFILFSEATGGCYRRVFSSERVTKREERKRAREREERERERQSERRRVKERDRERRAVPLRVSATSSCCLNAFRSIGLRFLFLIGTCKVRGHSSGLRAAVFVGMDILYTGCKTKACLSFLQPCASKSRNMSNARNIYI